MPTVYTVSHKPIYQTRLLAPSICFWSLRGQASHNGAAHGDALCPVTVLPPCSLSIPSNRILHILAPLGYDRPRPMCNQLLQSVINVASQSREVNIHKIVRAVPTPYASPLRPLPSSRHYHIPGLVFCLLPAAQYETYLCNSSLGIRRTLFGRRRQKALQSRRLCSTNHNYS
ncbi:hypothetical protein OH76DRAFT_527608 [Lentinus brumalis]|uniref:Uncharacterized protein n=1 Tax=Lentinus brumalis TaxID=2498619 RepID=A0A371DA39_9APHY|nr:hypothetical protein OH76DRAFT_527608 [Polyporus brumalis]